jgi:tight adherence protein B
MALGPLLIGILATICLGGIALVILPYLSGEVRAERRQDQFVNRVVARENAAVQRTAASRREQVSKSLKDLDQRQSKKKKVDLATRITQAGLIWTKKRYFIVSSGLALGFGLVAFLVSRTKKRIKKFVNEFPNAMDVIVRGVKSGLPLGDCIRIIGSEAAEPVRSEFRHIIESQTLGLSVAEACERLFQRVPVTEANFFGIVIAIQQKAGGNLAETLSNLSRVIRERRKMSGKIQAMSAEAKASAGIIAALPFIVGILVYLSSPDYITLLWTTFHGKITMLIAGTWMGIGILVMRKMIAFDF